MSIRQVNAALVQQFKTLSLTVPIEYEARSSFVPPVNAAWAAVFNLPADLSVSSLGVGGMDRFLGVFQIDFHSPPNSGVGQLQDWCDQTRVVFSAGSTITYQTQDVKIIKAVPSSLRSDPNGGVVQSMSIYYRADMPR